MLVLPRGNNALRNAQIEFNAPVSLRKSVKIERSEKLESKHSTFGVKAQVGAHQLQLMLEQQEREKRARLNDFQRFVWLVSEQNFSFVLFLRPFP